MSVEAEPYATESAGGSAHGVSAGGSAHAVELRIPARTEFLAVARMVVVAAAALDPSFTEERLDNLRLAVSEACTNAIEAHATVGSHDQVRVRCDRDGGRIEVEVEDHGHGFDPSDLVALPEPDDPERLDFESGLGIMLMRSLTDRTEIESSPEGTLVRLVMYGIPGLDAAGNTT